MAYLKVHPWVWSQLVWEIAKTTVDVKPSELWEGMITVLQGTMHEKEFWLYGSKDQELDRQKLQWVEFIKIHIRINKSILIIRARTRRKMVGSMRGIWECVERHWDPHLLNFTRENKVCWNWRGLYFMRDKSIPSRREWIGQVCIVGDVFWSNLIHSLLPSILHNNGYWSSSSSAVIFLRDPTGGKPELDHGNGKAGKVSWLWT